MFTKAEVQFEHPARGMSHCSQCVHFLPTVEACRIVRGDVKQGDWCSEFKRKGTE